MTHFGDNIVSFFKNTATSLEELQLQTSLGKAELTDKVEEIKKVTKQNIHEMKNDMRSFVGDQKEHYDHLKGKLEHLEMQIALGKAETIEELNKQKKNLSEAFRDVKNALTRK